MEQSSGRGIPQRSYGTRCLSPSPCEGEVGRGGRNADHEIAAVCVRFAHFNPRNDRFRVLSEALRIRFAELRIQNYEL